VYVGLFFYLLAFLLGLGLALSLVAEVIGRVCHSGTGCLVSCSMAWCATEIYDTIISYGHEEDHVRDGIKYQ